MPGAKRELLLEGLRWPVSSKRWKMARFAAKSTDERLALLAMLEQLRERRERDMLEVEVLEVVNRVCGGVVRQVRTTWAAGDH